MMKIKATTVLTVMTLLLMTGLVQGASSPPASAVGTNYYLSAAGDDGNIGTSAEAPWKSLEKIESTALQPGDSVSFRSGDTWTGGVVINGSGTVRSPIKLNSYG